MACIYATSFTFQADSGWMCLKLPVCLFVSLLQVGVGQEAKLQEWFHLPQDMASPR